ncbi:hypothetical protein [Kitasatospora sp. NPDC057015]|uniref:hypothetical protein n=1 Tax=Kitasatospora sp. NPDC057015 TaxID=3346001 RepID=UPI003642449A
MPGVPLLIDATVAVSVLTALVLAPGVVGPAPGEAAPQSAPQSPARPRPAGRWTVHRPDRWAGRWTGHRPARTVGPGAALAVVIALLYLNQLAVTVYVLREHGGDPSFIARHLPAGWFSLADGNAPVRWLAAHWPAPRLLAPSVLRVPALLELPFVLLAFATVLRTLDTGLYRRVARSPLIRLAAASYTVAFCAVEWQLHNPYTVDDILLRVLSALVTPALIAALAARDAGPPRPAGAAGLLLFGVSLWALGRLVLALYDTALLYDMSRIGAELPAAALALAVLAAAHRARAALPADGPEPGPAVRALATGLRRGLVLFLVPALAVRYGVDFATPEIAVAGGAVVLLAAAAPALRAGTAGRRPPIGRLALAAGAGLAAAYPAASRVSDAYYEAGLLRAAGAFLLTAVAVAALADRAAGPARERGRTARTGAGPRRVGAPDARSSPDRKEADSLP